MKVRTTMLTTMVLLVALSVPPARESKLAAMPLDLGSLDGGNSGADSINDRGRMVGWSQVLSLTSYHAFLWTPEAGMIDLGTAAGDAPYTPSYALAINNLDQAVGWGETLSGAWDAYLWSAPASVSILPLGNHWQKAHDINNQGQVVGGGVIYRSACDSTGEWHAVRWTAKDGALDLGYLGNGDSSCTEYSSGNAINENGDVVGESRIASGEMRAFLWTAQNGMADLGTLGGTYSTANAINAHGEVVGESRTAAGATHAFLWTAQAGMADLGTLGGKSSGALSVNERNMVVGESETSSGEIHAFLWTRQNGMQDLGTLGGASSVARSINQRGDIVGECATPSGQIHACLWYASSSWSRSRSWQKNSDPVAPPIDFTIGPQTGLLSDER